MKLLLLMTMLASGSSFAQINTRIYDSVGRNNPNYIQPSMIAPPQQPRQQMNFQTINSGNTSYTTGTDSQGNSVNCRTIHDNGISHTICN